MNYPQTFRSRIALTFTTLSAIIILIQMVLFYDMVLETEDRVLTNRMELYGKLSLDDFEEDDDGIISVDQLTNAYLGLDKVPEPLRSLLPPEWLGIDEFEIEENVTEYMVYALPDPHLSGHTVYIVMDIVRLENSTPQRYLWTGRYMILSVLLFTMAAMAVLYLAKHLTLPLSILERRLRESQTDDLSPLSLPVRATLEVHQLANSLNAYRSRLGELIERERSFTRYASHEFRTPLTVIRGVGALLDVSSEPEFIQRQKRRLLNAATAMNDVIDTLLNLAREEKESLKTALEVDHSFLDQIIDDHRQLLRGKAVEVNVSIHKTASVYAPEAVVRILLSNLIRNAMACTQEGEVRIVTESQSLCIIDSGCGLDKQPDGHQGFGLGLLIVNDICRKYGWDFSLTNNASGTGCAAEVIFGSRRDKPSLPPEILAGPKQHPDTQG
ncbi:sensor histidine kinase [Sansalvadorimonas verongulae]|uniref:sensor histidine kinase n=1 Tax=Sansalvadorimonas verongulae TaxID=2172824 RepID=UPI0018AD1F51|nr:HAMP domain-containing sensor histidine kinase [Sansalvadorimonas verongulae]